MRWVVVSLLVHAAIIAGLMRGDEKLVAWQPPALPTYQHIESETIVELIEEPAVKGGGATSARSWRVQARTPADRDAWERITVRTEQAAQGDGRGQGGGDGTGNGQGNGIGFGAGGGVRVASDIPAPPPPPATSKARPAKLVWPTRDEEVEDEDDLFIARVTVGPQGDVIGASMVKTRPGARGDRAADLIWQFRYAPALDDRGVAVRSTFEQPFQVR